jgi:HEAT repeat protein
MGRAASQVLLVALLLGATACGASPLRARAVGTLRDALSAAAPEARLAAIEAAERLDEGSLFDPVTRLLSDDDERVRAAAAAATVKGHPDAARVLVQSLAAGDPAARVIATSGLGRKVGAMAIDELRVALADPAPEVREAAILAITPVAEPADLARLVALATGDASGAVRARALTALSRRKPEGTAEAARRGLDDRYLGARLAAAEALVALGVPVAGADPFVALRVAVLAGRVGDAVRAAAASRDVALRAAAANAAGRGEAEVAGALARDPDPGVRLAGARALLRAGRDAEARAVLERALGLPDPWLRLQAATDLARLGDARALEPFVVDPEGVTRRLALAAYPRREGIPRAWVTALDDADGEVRVLAAELILRAL